MKEVLPWVAFLDKYRGMQTKILKTSTENCINLMLELKLNDDTLMNEMYMGLSYLLLERLGEED